MKKSINFQAIGVFFLFAILFNFLINLVKKIGQRKKQNVIHQEVKPPTIEPQPEKTVIHGFQPKDPQDEFFVTENLKDDEKKES